MIIASDDVTIPKTISLFGWTHGYVAKINEKRTQATDLKPHNTLFIYLRLYSFLYASVQLYFNLQAEGGYNMRGKKRNKAM